MERGRNAKSTGLRREEQLGVSLADPLRAHQTMELISSMLPSPCILEHRCRLGFLCREPVHAFVLHTRGNNIAQNEGVRFTLNL